MVRVWCASVLLVLSFVVAAFADADTDGARVVRLAQGAVRGHRQPAGHYAFYGIPYATAPTGPHKFKGPLPAPMWLDTFEAIDKKIICPQPKLILPQLENTDGQFKMDENCLIANVFVPDTEETNLPVVVYVHGGAFQLGFGNMIIHSPILNSRKVIEVNFNYRVGGHGFLCLGTEDVPGNAGMKDQVAALRWVKNNIASFGGNPDDISLAGYSAGAAAVELLLVSKSTRGLFNKVIPESGAGVGVWAVQSDPLQTAKTYAQSQGYTGGDDIYALEEFFKNLPLDVLQADAFMERPDNTFVFSPCVERKETSDNPFLTDAPTNIIKKGDYEKLPMLMGFADMEGIFRLQLFEKWKILMNENFSKFLPADLRFESEDEREQVAKKIKEFYFGDEAVSEENALGFVNYFSDVLFVYPTHRSVSLQLAAGSDALYFYVYAFADTTKSTTYPGVTGAGHCDQSFLLGDLTWAPVTGEDRSDNSKKMKQLLVDVWQNFITTGNPAPGGSFAAKILGGEWRPTSATRPQHALFNATSELRAELWSDRMALWDEIYSKYYFTPIPPPEPPKKPKTEL